MKSAPLSWAQIQERKRRRRALRDPVQSAIDRPISAVLMLRPNGDHWLRLDLNGVSVLTHVGQLPRFEALFAAVRTEIDADDQRTNDRPHMASLKLGPF
jgi:hypothetical protein